MLHLHLVYTLMQLAELEEHFGIKVLSHHWPTMAETLLATAETYYWDANRQLFADDLEHKSFSQHAQVLAVLTRLLNDDRTGSSWRVHLAMPISFGATFISPITFSEAASLYDGGDYLRQRLGDWHALVEQGYKTFPEHFGGTRSECHAWSAHVLFHILHTIAGIKPSGLGINHLRLEPNLRSGEWLKASVAHPAGTIELNLPHGKHLGRHDHDSARDRD